VPTYSDADFIARIYPWPRSEGGDWDKPLSQGMRPDFSYEGEPDQYMIHPEFIDESGALLSRDVEIRGPIRARMWILDPVRRRSIHLHRIRPGVRFWCMNGRNRIARGEVLDVTGLPENAAKPVD
jgi:hypothetical protein